MESSPRIQDAGLANALVASLVCWICDPFENDLTAFFFVQVFSLIENRELTNPDRCSEFRGLGWKRARFPNTIRRSSIEGGLPHQS